MDPTRAAHEAGLDVGDVGSERYHHALGYLLEEVALLGDEHTATEAGGQQHHGYAAYFFTRPARETTNMYAIAQKITSRAGMTSSAGTALVSHE